MQDEVFVEVNRSALKHNLQQVSQLANTPVLAVVKANGYGHGIVESARVFAEAGAWGLAVTRLNEALQIRQAGIQAPILVFSPVIPANAQEAVDLNVIATVDRLDCAAALSLAAAASNKKIDVHVKVDTGMGRLGVRADSAVDFVKNLLALPGIRLSGVYTHFACAPDRDPAPTKHQLSAFKDVIDKLKTDNIGFGLAHCANSAALIRFSDSRMDLVRPGTLLYGQYPAVRIPKSLSLKETWKLKARVVDIRDMPAGSTISYGAEYTTRHPIKMAIIPVGWADGYAVTPEGPIYRQGLISFAVKRARNKKHCIVNGKRAHVIGRVSMQLTCLDITEIDGVQIGDVVELPAMRIPIDSCIPRVYIE